jgi:hypothetical protein
LLKLLKSQLIQIRRASSAEVYQSRAIRPCRACPSLLKLSPIAAANDANGQYKSLILLGGGGRIPSRTGLNVQIPC